MSFITKNCLQLVASCSFEQGDSIIAFASDRLLQKKDMCINVLLLMY